MEDLILLARIHDSKLVVEKVTRPCKVLGSIRMKKHGQECRLGIAWEGDVIPSPIQQRHTSKAMISVLKSALQKEIRRGKEQHAVSVAWRMIQAGPSGYRELVRRLPIIYLEDTAPCQHVLVLAWLLVASDHFPESMSWEQSRRFLLRCCSWLALCPDPPIPYTGQPFQGNVLDLDSVQLGICIRMQYGATKHDTLLMSRAIVHWSNHDPPDDHFPPLITPGQLRISWYAVDYHVYPMIVKKIADQLGLDQRHVRSSIWNHASSINIRKEKAKVPDDFKPLKRLMKSLAGQYLARIT